GFDQKQIALTIERDGAPLTELLNQRAKFSLRHRRWPKPEHLGRHRSPGLAPVDRQCVLYGIEGRLPLPWRARIFLMGSDGLAVDLAGEPVSLALAQVPDG